jgi:pseudomonalisin
VTKPLSKVVRPAISVVLCAGTTLGIAAVFSAPASAAPRAANRASLTATETDWMPTATKSLTPANATLLGSTPASTPVTVRVALELRNQAALQSLIATGSAELSPSQFASEYGPTAASVSAVESYLTSMGFSGVTVTSNNLLVSANGTAGEAESAFDTSLDDFAQGGSTVYANVTGASVPATLGSVVGSVLGLNDIVGVRLPLVTAPGDSPAGTSVSVPQYDVSYTPNQFPSIYGATSATPTGSKTQIAIIAEGNLTQVVTDLRLEEKANNLPQVPVTIVPTGIASTDTSGMDEWDLDTQISTGMANTVKRLYLYDATSLTDSDLALAFNAFAAQDVAKAGSASLGECEVLPYLDGAMLADDEAFAEAAAQGQSFFASSGDTGASCAVESTNGVPDSGPPMVNYPASSPYVTAVGGTSLFTNSNDSYDTEIAWNAGGGGTSLFESAPFWQEGVVPGASVGKGVPDLAMDADPYSGATIFIDGAETAGIGGTSLSSPLSLGVWARLESGHANKLGMASVAVYDTYNAGTCTATAAENICTTPAFHDITVGSNGAYAATPGWDYTTGVGSWDIQEAEQLIK